MIHLSFSWGLPCKVAVVTTEPEVPPACPKCRHDQSHVLKVCFRHIHTIPQISICEGSEIADTQSWQFCSFIIQLCKCTEFTQRNAWVFFEKMARGTSAELGFASRHGLSMLDPPCPCGLPYTLLLYLVLLYFWDLEERACL